MSQRMALANSQGHRLSIDELWMLPWAADLRDERGFIIFALFCLHNSQTIYSRFSAMFSRQIKKKVSVFFTDFSVLPKRRRNVGETNSLQDHSPKCDFQCVPCKSTCTLPRRHPVNI